MKIKKVLTANLKPGMVSSEAAYTYTNHLVIQSNTVLTEEIIEKLKYYAVKAVKVYVQEESENTSGTVNSKQSNVLETVEGVSAQVLPEGETDTVSAAVEQLAGPTYFERVQQSEEFRVFESEFTDCVGGFRQSLNDIVTKSTDGLVDSMLGDVDALLKKTRNPLHLLDMLQCMRGYDDMTYTHSMNVALICNVIGNWLRMNEKDLKVLVTCGLLHDIGKLRVPNDIITKPGKLTVQEYEIVKKHPQYGYEMLKGKNLDRRVKLAALQHHERFGGTGYPYGLMGSDIEYFSSIVAVADVYDAMTSNRCYRKGICPFKVIGILEQDKDAYEPGVLYLFMERTIEAYVNTEVLLSNGEQGKVVLLNKSLLSRPVVMTDKETIYDLSKDFRMSIEALI